LNFVKDGADLSDRVLDGSDQKKGDSAVRQWFDDNKNLAAE